MGCCSGSECRVGWDVVVSLLGVSGWVVVDLGYGDVVVVVFWSIWL